MGKEIIERPATLAECNRQMAQMFASEPKPGQMLGGKGAPDPGHGRPGDFYFDADERAFYYKEGEAWGEPMYFATVLSTQLEQQTEAPEAGMNTTTTEAGQPEGTGVSSAAGADASAPATQDAANALPETGAAHDTDAAEAAMPAEEPEQSDDQADTGAADPAPKGHKKGKKP